MCCAVAVLGITNAAATSSTKAMYLRTVSSMSARLAPWNAWCVPGIAVRKMASLLALRAMNPTRHRRLSSHGDTEFLPTDTADSANQALNRLYQGAELVDGVEDIW